MAKFDWHTLDEASYRTQRFTFVGRAEGNILSPYLDSKAIPTIGIGFNLRTQPAQSAALREIFYGAAQGGFTVPDQNYAAKIVEVVDAAWTGKTNADLQHALNEIMAARGQDTAVPGAQKRSIFSFATLGESQGVFDTLAPSFETAVDRFMPGIPQSMERAALFSLAWNGAVLLDAGLHDALTRRNRADAWLQIRYRMNGGHTAGAEKRQYGTSQIFGLQNPGALDAGEAAQIVSMAKTNATLIAAVNKQFPDAEMAALATRDYGFAVATTGDALRPAQSFAAPAAT